MHHLQQVQIIPEIMILKEIFFIMSADIKLCGLIRVINTPTPTEPRSVSTESLITVTAAWPHCSAVLRSVWSKDLRSLHQHFLQISRFMNWSFVLEN